MAIQVIWAFAPFASTDFSICSKSFLSISKNYHRFWLGPIVSKKKIPPKSLLLEVVGKKQALKIFYSGGILARILQREGFLHRFPFSSGWGGWCNGEDTPDGHNKQYKPSPPQLMVGVHSHQHSIHTIRNKVVISIKSWITESLMQTNEASKKVCRLFPSIHAPRIRSPPFPIQSFAQCGIICGRILVQNVTDLPNAVLRCFAIFLLIVRLGMWHSSRGWCRKTFPSV